MAESAPEAPEAVVIRRNRRTDAMFAAAYVAVGWLVYIVVFIQELNEYAQGVITLVLGAFIGFLTAMFNFETGTTRGAQAKDATIKSMAESANGKNGAVTPAPATANGIIPAAEVAAQPKESIP